jgi:transcriptional regulator with XRE-family HTH domain
MQTARDIVEEESTPERIGLRLQRLRILSGLNQTEYAAGAQIGINAWNNYEHGRKRISIDAALRLVATYHVSLDYIYLGDTGGLPRDLFNLLMAYEQSRTPAR